jgi:hypothetical protein
VELEDQPGGRGGGVGQVHLDALEPVRVPGLGQPRVLDPLRRLADSDPDANGNLARMHQQVWTRCQADLDDLALRHDSPALRRLSRIAAALLA